MMDSKLSQAEQMKQLMSFDNMNADIMQMDNSFISSSSASDWSYAADPTLEGSASTSGNKVPEGRVHGGSLMAALNGKSALSLSRTQDGNPSQVGEPWIRQNWG